MERGRKTMDNQDHLGIVLALLAVKVFLELLGI